MNVDFPHCAAAAASPFAEGERIEVRGFLQDGGSATLALPSPLRRERQMALEQNLEREQNHHRRGAHLPPI